jgi:septum formation protein
VYVTYADTFDSCYNHYMETIILASSSQRRQDFFNLLGIPFSVLPAMIDESHAIAAEPLKLTAELAVKKVEKAIEMTKERSLERSPGCSPGCSPLWICGADTVITLDGEIFGKPENKETAACMLRKLSGKEHKAITSIAIYNGRKGKIDCRSAACTVSFAAMNEGEIDWYLNTNEWQGAAGAYRIQGLGSCFITGIKGCQSTVVGLPLRDFYVILRDNGYPFGG